MSQHHITNAANLSWGKTYYPRARQTRGIPIQPLLFIDLGKPAAADADGLINDATSTELPNDDTIVYAFPADNESPTDEVLRTGVLDVPRNIVVTATHNSSLVAMDFLITGLDQYGETVVELLQISATGTSKSATGKKAFKQVTSIAITSGGDATANTVNVGTGQALGLPFRAEANCVLSPRGANAADTGTFVPADSTTPSATTGDVRGTYAPSTTLNGSNQIGLLLVLQPPSTKTSLYGVDQYAG